MPELYDGKCTYQKRAQPYLEAIALGIRDSAQSRAFVLKNTEYEKSFTSAAPLWLQQWVERDPNDKMRCPFWSNYFYEPCQNCSCRIDNSVSMEVDAMFFLQRADGKRLALHVEMKRDNEPLSIGQAEAYRPRAACFRDQRRQRKGLMPHDYFVTVLFCGRGTDIQPLEQHFDRIISHESARRMFPKYLTA